MKVVAILEAECGRRAEIDFQPMQPGDVRQSYADIDAIAGELGLCADDFDRGGGAQVCEVV